MPKRFFEIILGENQDDENKWTWQPLAFLGLLIVILGLILKG